MLFCLFVFFRCTVALLDLPEFSQGHWIVRTMPETVTRCNNDDWLEHMSWSDDTCVVDELEFHRHHSVLVLGDSWASQLAEHVQFLEDPIKHVGGLNLKERDRRMCGGEHHPHRRHLSIPSLNCSGRFSDFNARYLLGVHGPPNCSSVPVSRTHLTAFNMTMVYISCRFVFCPSSLAIARQAILSHNIDTVIIDVGRWGETPPKQQIDFPHMPITLDGQLQWLIRWTSQLPNHVITRLWLHEGYRFSASGPPMTYGRTPMVYDTYSADIRASLLHHRIQLAEVFYMYRQLSFFVDMPLGEPDFLNSSWIVGHGFAGPVKLAVARQLLCALHRMWTSA